MKTENKQHTIIAKMKERTSKLMNETTNITTTTIQE